jgi:pyruvate carboxylase
MMVSQDLSVHDVENPLKDIAFPESVVSMLRGDLGQPLMGWPFELQKKVLKGETPNLARPGSLIAPVDLTASKQAIEKKLDRPLSDQEFASWLMYPKVFTDFTAVSETYGPVSILPTPVYFYGLRPEDEIFIDLEKGKTLVIACVAIGEIDDQGMVTVFFEVNGQSRRVKVPNRTYNAKGTKIRRKAELGNEQHIAAPMPGVVSALLVNVGQTVKAGDILISIEAMKMETALHADKNGTISEILVKQGDQIDAKDLLIVMS